MKAVKNRDEMMTDRKIGRQKERKEERGKRKKREERRKRE